MHHEAAGDFVPLTPQLVPIAHLYSTREVMSFHLGHHSPAESNSSPCNEAAMSATDFFAIVDHGRKSEARWLRAELHIVPYVAHIGLNTGFQSVCFFAGGMILY